MGAAFVFRGAEGDIILDPDEHLPYDINADEPYLHKKTGLDCALG